MFHTLHRYSLMALILAGIIFAGAEPAFAQDKLILVLDSSGSMAGQIEQKTKLNIARDAIRDLLGKLKPSTRLGLIAYGHRRKGDCADIETIYRVGKPNADAIMNAVGRLRAVGKTPLSTAVLQAAEQLNFTEERATVILVSDGKENCGADPCQLGRELKAKGIDLKVHVVGFDIKGDERAGLQCLADATGGRYVPAKSARDLGDAVYQAVEVAQTAEPEPPIPEPVAQAGLRVDVVVSEGGDTFEGEIGFKIFAEKTGLDGNRKEVAGAWRKKSGYIFKNLPASKYLLEVVLADHPHIKRAFTIEVLPDQAQIVTANMNIGQVRFDASLAEDGEPFNGDLGWTILSTKKDLNEEHNKIAKFWRVKSGEVFWLPAGTWRLDGVIADANYLSVSRELKVDPGGGAAHAFSFNAGTVRFDASLATETVTFDGDLGWNILSKTKDLSGKREKITKFWRVKSGEIFLLPTGNWLVSGVFADHQHVTTDMTIDVTAGSEFAHEFNFNAGKVRYDVMVNGKPTGDELGLSVLSLEKDLAGKRKQIAKFWRVKSGYITFLPAGNYLVQGLLADQKEMKGEVTLEVKPGDEQAIAIDLTR